MYWAIQQVNYICTSFYFYFSGCTFYILLFGPASAYTKWILTNSRYNRSAVLHTVYAYQTDTDTIIWLFGNKICRMSGLTGKKMKNIFETLVPETVHSNARNLVEYCCFRFLSRDDSDIHPSLQVLNTVLWMIYWKPCSFSVLICISPSWSHQTCTWYLLVFHFIIFHIKFAVNILMLLIALGHVYRILLSRGWYS
jgi:hypothetical protein